MTKRVILIILALVVFTEVIFYLSYYSQLRTPDQYVLPSQYQGWAALEVGNPDCSATKTINGFNVYFMNAVGCACTKDTPKNGKASDSYVYQGQEDINLMQNPITGKNKIWYEYNTSMKSESIGTKKYFIFYVGDEMKNDVFDNSINEYKLKLSHSFCEK